MPTSTCAESYLEDVELKEALSLTLVPAALLSQLFMNRIHLVFVGYQEERINES